MIARSSHSHGLRPSLCHSVQRLHTHPTHKAAVSRRHHMRRFNKSDGDLTTVELDAATNTPATFSWFDHWYPVAPLSTLDPAKPAHIDLLGLSLVVWADSQSNWYCMEDRCPHRLAPLSEGRLEGDTLQCSYHGWRFSCTGSCAHIPQIDDPKAHTTAIASPRASVKSLPTRVAHGLLWVEPQEVATKPFLKDLGHLDGTRFTWNHRDMPLRWDTVLENIMDPAHVPFAHHGVQGDRNQITNQQFSPGAITPKGFSVDMGAAPFPLHNLRIVGEWSPPFRYRVHLPGTQISFENWVVPTKPGWCRFMSSLPHPPTPPGPPASLPELIKRISIWFLKTFPTLDHLYRQQVLDGDAVILHLAERELHSNAKGDWRRSYFMPASADAQVSTFRRWLDAYGGEVPTCSAEDVKATMSTALPKEQILDRFSQHTRSCSHCLGALKAIDLAIPLCTAVGFVAAVAAIAAQLMANSGTAAAQTSDAAPLAADSTLAAPLATTAASAIASQVSVLLPSSPTSVALAAAAIAVAMWFAVKGLQRWRASYYYLEYEHALR